VEAGVSRFGYSRCGGAVLLILLSVFAWASPLDDVVGALEDGGRVRVAAGIVRWDGTEVAYGGGADSETLFEIGSASKVYAALLLADASVRGELGLDDSIDSVLPTGVRFPGGPGPTWRQLSTHTAGLPHTPPNLTKTDRGPKEPYSIQELWEAVSMTTRAPPTYTYSNFGVGLLAECLGELRGVPYPQLLNERVLQPVGLQHTGFLDPPKGRGRDGKHVYNRNFEGIRGAGAMDSTVIDQMTWLQTWLDPDRTPLAAAIRVAAERHDIAGLGEERGLGWRVLYKEERAFYYHTGTTNGYNTFMGFEPLSGVGVVILRGKLEEAVVREQGIGLLRSVARRPMKLVDTVALGRLVALPGEVSVSRRGVLVNDSDGLGPAPGPPTTRSIGFWVALAAIRAQAEGQLDLSQLVDGQPLTQHVRKAWQEPTDLQPLRDAIEGATGRSPEDYLAQRLLPQLDIPPAMVGHLRPRDLHRVGELLEADGEWREGRLLAASDVALLQARATGPVWEDPEAELALWLPNRRLVVVQHGAPLSRDMTAELRALSTRNEP
jgi:serine-type D-Ala-D-Ala carboxypeptidase/endopeptidase